MAKSLTWTGPYAVLVPGIGKVEPEKPVVVEDDALAEEVARSTIGWKIEDGPAASKKKTEKKADPPPPPKEE